MSDNNTFDKKFSDLAIYEKNNYLYCKIYMCA